MVRGLFSKLQFAYAHFSCSALNGHHLYPIFWEAIERLERCRFHVHVMGFLLIVIYLNCTVKACALMSTRRITSISLTIAIYTFLWFTYTKTKTRSTGIIKLKINLKYNLKVITITKIITIAWLKLKLKIRELKLLYHFKTILQNNFFFILGDHSTWSWIFRQT